MNARILPCGPTAVVIEVHGTDQAIELSMWLRARELAGVTELVPAATTVLVQTSTAAALAGLDALVAEFEPTGRPGITGQLVAIDTVYDGEDLDDVATAAGISVEAVVALHSEATYIAAFCGFVPGFAYLTGLAPQLQLPRRSSPRPRVPAGSVAIATSFTGVYPTASPGGWNLLGRTEATMWDDHRERPALVEPGDRVRFVPVGR